MRSKAFLPRQSGQVLPIIIFAAVIGAIAAAYVLTSFRRKIDVARNESDIQKIAKISNVMSHVLAAAPLCTCNLRGYSVVDSGGNLSAIINAANSVRRKFGYSQLNDKSECVGAEFNEAIEDKNVVLYLSKDDTDLGPPNAINVSQIALSGFVSQGSPYKDLSNPGKTLQKYKADFKFFVYQNFKLARSNQRDPVEVTAYLEIDSDKKIRGCYLPGFENHPPCPAGVTLSWQVGSSSCTGVTASSQDVGKTALVDAKPGLPTGQATFLCGSDGAWVTTAQASPAAICTSGNDQCLEFGGHWEKGAQENCGDICPYDFQHIGNSNGPCNCPNALVFLKHACPSGFVEDGFCNRPCGSYCWVQIDFQIQEYACLP